MIRDAEAILVCDASEVIDLLDFARGGSGRHEGESRPAPSDRDGLGARERRLLDALPARGVATTETLCARVGLAMRDVLAALGILESTGWISADQDGWRLVRR
jgi:predicted Rossmann fold nucleotide-binding protein DprA/Smf involved in DNA uptake